MKRIQNLGMVVHSSEFTKKTVKNEQSELTKDQNEILELYFEKKLTLKEIAAEMNYPYGSVYNKFHKAIFFLKNKFNPSAYEKAYSILYPETGRPG